MLIKLGREFNLSLDLEKKVLVIETMGSNVKPYVIEIPIERAFEIGKVVWNKRIGEKFEDVAKKKPPKKEIFDRTKEKVIGFKKGVE